MLATGEERKERTATTEDREPVRIDDNNEVDVKKPKNEFRKLLINL